MNDAVERFLNTRTPPRPPEMAVGSAGGGGGSGFVPIKFDGARTGRRYTGHIMGDNGTLGAACQFVIENDDGTGDRVTANHVLWCRKAPARLANLGIWLVGGGDKYVSPMNLPTKYAD